MRIGAAARLAGLTVKAIRHYEAIGLLPRVRRSGEYRCFSAADIQRLKTIAHCRSLGFSLDEIRAVLDLVAQAAPACPAPEDMAAVVEAKLGAVRDEIAALQRRATQLEAVKRYLDARRGEESPPAAS